MKKNRPWEERGIKRQTPKGNNMVLFFQPLFLPQLYMI